MSVALGVNERPTLLALDRAASRPLEAQERQLRRAGAEDVLRALAPAVRTWPAERPWQPPDRWLHHDEVQVVGTRRLRVVETPGHTRGHVVFHDAEGALLFAGDYVLPSILHRWASSRSSQTTLWRHSADRSAKVRDLPDAWLLPAHGAVSDSTYARVDELIAHHGRRLDLVAAAVHEGHSSGVEVARALGWTRHEGSFDDLDPFNAMLAVCETVAHLELLVPRGGWSHRRQVR